MQDPEVVRGLDLASRVYGCIKLLHFQNANTVRRWANPRHNVAPNAVSIPPPPKRRKVEHEPSPHRTGILSECDAATLQWSLGPEFVSERSLGLDEACHVADESPSR